jgi:hypothetical protein
LCSFVYEFLQEHSLCLFGTFVSFPRYLLDLFVEFRLGVDDLLEGFPIKLVHFASFRSYDGCSAFLFWYQQRYLAEVISIDQVTNL